MKKFPLSLTLLATLVLTLAHSNAFGGEGEGYGKYSKQGEEKKSKQGEEKCLDDCSYTRYTSTHLSPSERRGLRREQRRLERQVRKAERRSDRQANREYRQARRFERKVDRFNRRLDRQAARMERRLDRWSNKVSRFESKYGKYGKYGKTYGSNCDFDCNGKKSKQGEKENQENRRYASEESRLPAGWHRVGEGNKENTGKENKENTGKENKENTGKENKENTGKENKENTGKENKENTGKENKENTGKENKENTGKENKENCNCECECDKTHAKEHSKTCKHRTGVGHFLAWIGHGFRNPDGVKVGEKRSVKDKVVTDGKTTGEVDKTKDQQSQVQAQVNGNNVKSEDVKVSGTDVKIEKSAEEIKNDGLPSGVKVQVSELE